MTAVRIASLLLMSFVQPVSIKTSVEIASNVRFTKFILARCNEAAQLVIFGLVESWIARRVCFQILDTRASVVNHDALIGRQEAVLKQLAEGRDASSSFGRGKHPFQFRQLNSRIQHVTI